MSTMLDVRTDKMHSIAENDTVTYLKEAGVLLNAEQSKTLTFLSLQDLSNINFPKDFDDLCNKLNLDVMVKLKFKTAIQNLQNESNINVYDNVNTLDSNATEYLISDAQTRSLPLTDDKDTYLSFSVSLLGNSGVGKTCIIQRFVSDVFDALSLPTIGLDVCVKKVSILDTKCKLTLLDTVGQEMFQSIGNWLYRASHAFIICYDITDVQSFNALHGWLVRIGDKGSEYAKRFIVGTKTDIGEKERVIAFNEGFAFAQLNGCKFMEVSAKSGSNIKQLYLLKDNVMEKMGPSTIIGELDLTIHTQHGSKLSQFNDKHNTAPSVCKCS